MAEKNTTVTEQIIEYVRWRESRLNATPYFVLEFVIQAGKVDGARIKEYEKLGREDKGKKVLDTFHRM